ncbi:hypothetical protein CC78DRAFT_531220 [Lojkania enalia]|uniref:DUF1996 domain-containing protein n=1 Tax=Lojkania enalia TaxID=147567 RepID=A0A9P4KHV7_9PLEO|nr:hypothetical protein CC78DRAFT_531220 [Didymosphaeria enalia]
MPCPGGIGSNIILPLCWDGVSLDSPDHCEHIAHPIEGPTQCAIVNGTCPASHLVKIPQLMYEVMWDTRSFNNLADWPKDGSQLFVLSIGDDTGFVAWRLCLRLARLDTLDGHGRLVLFAQLPAIDVADVGCEDHAMCP